MSKVAAILLAAGLSRRMGAQNKLLLPVDGVPMIRHMVDVYAKIVTSPVIVVTGHEAEAIEVALVDTPVNMVFNPEFEAGQATSVATGLRAAPGDVDVLMGLGDQPLLTPADLAGLLSAHAAADTARISIPGTQARRGNPIIIPANLRARVLADPKSPGCKRFTRDHPEHVQFHPLAAPGYYADIDTPQAYAALRGHQTETVQ